LSSLGGGIFESGGSEEEGEDLFLLEKKSRGAIYWGGKKESIQLLRCSKQVGGFGAVRVKLISSLIFLFWERGGGGGLQREEGRGKRRLHLGGKISGVRYSEQRGNNNLVG